MGKPKNTTGCFPKSILKPLPQSFSLFWNHPVRELIGTPWEFLGALWDILGTLWVILRTLLKLLGTFWELLGKLRELLGLFIGKL